MVAYQCNIVLPRTEGSTYISLLDECGGHTKEYHLHERLSCLYAESGGHSTRVGTGTDGQSLYGEFTRPKMSCWHTLPFGKSVSVRISDKCNQFISVPEMPQFGLSFDSKMCCLVREDNALIACFML